MRLDLGFIREQLREEEEDEKAENGTDKPASDGVDEGEPVGRRRPRRTAEGARVEAGPRGRQEAEGEGWPQPRRRRAGREERGQESIEGAGEGRWGGKKAQARNSGALLYTLRPLAGGLRQARQSVERCVHALVSCTKGSSNHGRAESTGNREGGNTTSTYQSTGWLKWIVLDILYGDDVVPPQGLAALTLRTASAPRRVVRWHTRHRPQPGEGRRSW